MLNAAVAKANGGRAIAVELQDDLADAIRLNATANGFDDLIIETGYVGSPPPNMTDQPPITIESLLERHDLPRFDLIKMDIEGSEFALFDDTGWLARVNALAMELHPGCGQVRPVVDALLEAGFEVKLATDTFEPIALDAAVQRADFAWAWKPLAG